MRVFYFEANGFTNTGEYIKKITQSIAQNHCFSKIKVFTSRKNTHGEYGVGVFGNYGNSRKFLKLFWYIYGWIALTQTLLRIREPIVFHLHWLKFSIIDNFFLGLLKRRGGIFVVFTVHNILPHEKWVFDKFFYKRIYNKVDHLIFHTLQNKRDFGQIFPSMPRKPKTIIPHYSYDVVPYIPSVEDGIRFLFFGAIRSYKGIPIMLEALSKVSGEFCWNLTIAGKEETSTKVLKDLSQNDARLCGKVHWKTGWVEEEELDRLFRLAHVVILPYLRIDNSGLVHLAMSYGKTVVVPKIGAFLDLIEDGVNGYFFEVGNVDSLKSVLEKVLIDAAYQRVGEMAVKRMKRQSLPVIGKSLTEVYQQVIQ